MTTALVETWTPPQHWPELSGVIGLDLETHDPLIDSHGPGWALPGDHGRVLGFSVAWEQGQDYWPLTHEGEGNLPSALGWLKDQLKKPDLTVVCHQSLYERGWLGRLGIPIRGKVICTQTAAALVNEYRRGRYNLDDTAWDYLQQRKDEAALRDWAKAHGLHPKKDLHRFPAHITAPYGIQDGVLTRNLWLQVFKKLITEQDLGEVFQLEMDLQPVLLSMRARGVRVDIDRAEQASKGLRRLESGLQKELRGLHTFAADLSPWNAEQIAEVFDRKELDYPMTPKTEKPSFRKHWLAKHPDPVAQQIQQLREFDRLRNVFIDKYILGHQINGRVYPEWNPIPTDEGGAVSGRFSSSNPTLQNLPARESTAAKLVRGLFLPEEGQQWAALDYSQQEPRFMVHYGAVMNEDRPARLKLGGVDRLIEAYHNDPSTDIYKFLEKLTARERGDNKIVFLARAYGRGGGSMCQQLGLPFTYYTAKDNQIRMKAGPEGQLIIDAFDNAVPFLTALNDACMRKARTRGYIKTILGRRCRFRCPQIPGTGHFAFPYKALNRLIQGSSADQIKKSMIELYREGLMQLVTVHDENGLSVADRSEAERGAQIMEECLPLHVPSKVDIAMGNTWGDAM